MVKTALASEDGALLLACSQSHTHPFHLLSHRDERSWQAGPGSGQFAGVNVNMASTQHPLVSFTFAVSVCHLNTHALAYRYVAEQRAPTPPHPPKNNSLRSRQQQQPSKMAEVLQLARLAIDHVLTGSLPPAALTRALISKVCHGLQQTQWLMGCAWPSVPPNYPAPSRTRTAQSRHPQPPQPPAVAWHPIALCVFPRASRSCSAMGSLPFQCSSSCPRYD